MIKLKKKNINEIINEQAELSQAEPNPDGPQFRWDQAWQK